MYQTDTEGMWVIYQEEIDTEGKKNIVLTFFNDKLDAIKHGGEIMGVRSGTKLEFYGLEEDMKIEF